MQRQKSWADRQGLPTGVLGEVFLDRTGTRIPIRDENRATTWETRREGIELLLNWRSHYRSKGISCVLFGIYEGQDAIRYAVFVKDGVLREVGNGDNDD